MILRELFFENFRQFRGSHTIKFSDETGKDGKNVTVVFGDNGMGKTGIFRGLIFSLYGEKYLSSEEEASESDIKLVNLQALHEAMPDPITAVVSLRFEHNGVKYLSQRSVHAIATKDGKIIEELKNAKLTVTNPDGNSTVVTDPKDFSERIREVLDPRIRDYFLFDGEKIERLTRATLDQRKEVSRGIRSLLNIDAVESALKCIKKVKKDISKEVELKSTGEYANVCREVREIEADISECEANIEKSIEESILAEKELDDIDLRLKSFGEIAELLNEREALGRDKDVIESQLATLRTDMRRFPLKISQRLLSSTVSRVFDAIDSRKKKGEIPPGLRSDIIQKIIEEQKCLCGREVCEGTDAYKRIMAWMEDTEEQTVSDHALELWRHLSSVMARFDDYDRSVQQILIEYADLHNRLTSITERIGEIGDKIGDSECEDATKLENTRKNVESNIIDLRVRTVSLHSDLDILTQKHAQVISMRERLERDENLKNELISRRQLAEKTSDALQLSVDKYIKAIKLRMSEESTVVFHNLLDGKDQSVLSSIVVNDDYSLEISDKWESSFLSNISAGQRQIMSLSFITALAGIASNGKTSQFPLFMDTPFGRLSSGHRANLISYLPGVCSQWILLATDTELRRPEAELLKKTGRWAHFYKLDSAEKGGHTEIREMKINDAMAMLRSDWEEI